MREILFRGKRLDNGEWTEGYYVHIGPVSCQRTYIIPGYASTLYVIEVDPATVGQYTGLKDKHGKRIFEGDVVAQTWYDFDEPADDSFGEVVFSGADCSFSILDFNKNEIMKMGPGCAYHWEAEVIGNVTDNPELLKGGEQ